MRGEASRKGAVGRWRAGGGLLAGWCLLLSATAVAAPPEPPPEPSPEEAPEEAPWLDDQRLEVERRLGALIERFDHFFGDHRKQDVESPSTRLRLRTFERTTQERRSSWGVAVAASVHLPRLQEWLGNARLVLAGENTSSGAPVPLTGNMPPDGEAIPVAPMEPAATDLSRSRGSAELRFDLHRQQGMVVDTGAGVTFAWPLIPFARLRGHLRAGLGAGLVLRGTEAFFVELGGRGPGTSTDLLVERFLWTALRLRWEGHGLYAWHTRGVEWSTLVGAEWQALARTGLYAGVGANGFGTPSPGMEAWRTWLGVRQDVWRGWIFAELEPEVSWIRPAGMARRPEWAVTVRLEAVLESRQGRAPQEEPRQGGEGASPPGGPTR